MGAKGEAKWQHNCQRHSARPRSKKSTIFPTASDWFGTIDPPDRRERPTMRHCPSVQIIMQEGLVHSAPTLQLPHWCAQHAHWCVGTLKDGYVRIVPLPRVPRVQSTSEHVAAVTRDSRDTCYSQVPRVPTWSDLTRSLLSLGRRALVTFSPVWLM
jgi:hypothetical protein